ncbi:MAG: UDP-N-acetylglucosamine 1-carboxyvinyltransferase [Bacteroidota bacterium]|nr:UDP-N-acetylglucosamine 1-carboxyvinyltransferase [Bacteroidota bacterium]MDP4233498.1 UDP-N-acetylglucosamine 1-carboxyvinyltransferase [Bacteroidota bacterium]MDP4243375.1 UDP-N-acetylglucosamine 1-carboxyvinyltransferase [Bacteroidota bacterium]MDP4287938.1 UDP-N-acetylglucosamine 1-carboxyvinyltransferase [Bacteroidota bacterium]
MDAFLVKGGKPLSGTVRVSGTKNLISKVMVASMLSDSASTFTNAPIKLGEVDITGDIAKSLGTEIAMSSEANGTLTIQTSQFSTTVVPERFAGLNRIPILMIGPMLHRTGTASVPMPGGDKIGVRPVNYHISALEQMGAKIEFVDNYFHCTADKLTGTSITLPFPSVGATENIIMSAVLARGTTIIDNAAVEPEIIELMRYLQRMGAIINLETNRRIVIDGVDRLKGAQQRIMPDRIEAASFACAAIATKGDIFIEGALQSTMMTFLNNIRRAGADFDVTGGGIRFFYKDRLKPLAIETDVHPGFMTDWQQPWVLMMTQAHGMSVVHETVYENRFGYTQELRNMGAQIQLYKSCLGGNPCRFKTLVHPHSAVILGPTKLKGSRITIPDLRAGFVYLIAASLAEGESITTGIHHVERGYEHIQQKLAGLGVDIERITVDDV